MTNYTEHKDAALVELTLLGNQTAFEELVTRHERSVIGTAYKVTENEFSAQDASQDAFVSAWINLDSLKDRTKFGSWVCQIAKNKARTLVAHYRSTVPDISLDLLTNVELSDDDSEMLEMLGIAQLSKEEQNAQLHTAVEALGEKIREAVTLHYFEGLSVAEIAARLSLPAGTVKWRLCEGRKQLRKEYGIMEKTYDDKETLVKRVMRQVEELKLWRLKDDLTGFEAEYRRVLGEVEALDESNEKQYALADVLMTGYWWLPGERNDEVFAKMKDAALKSHNEEVMQAVLHQEYEKYSGKERLDFMKNTQMPFLKEKGFVKSLAYTYFWYGCYSRDEGNHEDCINAYNKALELLEPSDVYYANALAALDAEKKAHALGLPDEKFCFGVMGEVYKYIDGKLYFWTQPGYHRGYAGDYDSSLFWNCSKLDHLLYDPDMKPGDVKTSGKNTLTYKESGVSVDTPAGKFENCSVFLFEGETSGVSYCETVFCPGIGIVRQVVTCYDERNEWLLDSYTILGGSGMIPFAVGNKWSYLPKSTSPVVVEAENIFEVTAAADDSVTIKSYAFVQVLGYEDSWEGNILCARREYCTGNDDSEALVDVSESLTRAAELAKTKREKIHTAIATDVMKRIFDTDPGFSPDYTEKGRWNFFEFIDVEKNDGKVKISGSGKYNFEWKDMGNCGDEGYKVLYSFLYDILCDAAGCVWSDEWVPGYHDERNVPRWGKSNHLVFDVLDDESVKTKTETFENCRHVKFDLTGPEGGLAYRGGKMEYWFAPEIGIVKFSRPYGDDGKLDCIWELTDYRGKGEGYFPVADSLFRRYEPTELGNGWHGSVEYTFDEDETGTVLFRNALGTQDRANYEADIAEKENK